MSLGPIALKSDFARQSPETRHRLLELLRVLDEMRLSCRVEAVGRDLHTVVARGLPPAAYWLRAFTDAEEGH